MTSSNTLKTGGDPRALPDYASLCDELAKLSHPARPDVDWARIEQLSLSLFRQNGVELQTTLWYTLARTRLAGIVGLNEGLALLEALLAHQWAALWPQPVHIRAKSLAAFSQRLQTMLRTLTLENVALSSVYQTERHLSGIREVLERHNLKNISGTEELCAFMHHAAVRLEDKSAAHEAAVLPASSQSVAPPLAGPPAEPLIYVVREEPSVASETAATKSRGPRYLWRGFAAGLLTTLLCGAAGWWGWQKANPAANGPVPVAASEASLTQLGQLSPLWRQRYGFALIAKAKPEASGRLKAQWQHYIDGNALPAEALSGWHQGMEGLRDLTRRLNALDERKGKYLTGSELKSMVFAITQNFSRSMPVEERLYQLSQTEQGVVSAALLLQTDLHFNQLLNRYALLLQQKEAL